MNELTEGVCRLPEVVKLTGYSRSSLYNLERDGKFPPRLKLGDRAIGWRRRDVQSWIDNRPAASANKAV